MSNTKKTYQIINSSNDIAESIKANSLYEAKIAAEARIKSDGSYWSVDQWREVKCYETNQSLYLEEV